MDKPKIPKPNSQSNILIFFVALLSIWITFISASSFIEKSSEKRLAKKQGQVFTPKPS
jgi:hypothetical protein